MESTTATKGTEMTNQEAVETLRQMLNDWNNATDEQRAESLRIAKERADATEARLLAK